MNELLNAREERALRQAQLRNQYQCPLVCFTMNIAGPVKISSEITRAFNFGLSLLENMLQDKTIYHKEALYLKSGPVAYYSVLESADKIKKICVCIEESCSIGRLFDIDVLDVDGTKLERLTQRSCIVCKKKGRSCAASRQHSVKELQFVTKQLISSHFQEHDSTAIAKLAQESLIDEVSTTPKPGLVDKSNNGSHSDMNFDTFKKSAEALYPYFCSCIKTGIQTSEKPAEYTFDLLRQQGIIAEKNMLIATGGVNTHKGIIYSMGILCGAIGRLWTVESPIADTDNILLECSKMVHLSIKSDFDAIDNSTAGGKLYLSNGDKGIRGEVYSGFSSVKNYSLPVYKNCVKNGKNKNDAGVISLLHLIANINDTAVYNRGGVDGMEYTRKYAQALLSKNHFNMNDVKKMDEEFIKRNLSPGGAADLLAITFMLAKLESKREIALKEKNNSIV